MESPLIVYRREHDFSQKDLAEKLGVLAPAICKWEQRRVPADRVLDVERVTGISRHVLRPDIFGATVATLGARQGHQKIAWEPSPNRIGRRVRD